MSGPARIAGFVSAEVSPEGDFARLFYHEESPDPAHPSRTIQGEPRPIGAARRNKHCLWPSPTPYGTRYYSTPIPAGWDQLVFRATRQLVKTKTA